MPALGTRMPRSSDGKPPLSAYSSGCANSGTKVTVPGDVPMLAACVAGPFCRSAAVAPPTALPWIVRGVAATGSVNGFWWRFCTNGSKSCSPVATASASFAGFGTTWSPKSST